MGSEVLELTGAEEYRCPVSGICWGVRGLYQMVERSDVDRLLALRNDDGDPMFRVVDGRGVHK